MRTDGVLEFISGSGSSAFIFAFSADVDTTGQGQVFYRESTSQNDLNMAAGIYNSISDVPTNFTSVFVATWFYVGYFNSRTDPVC